MSDIVPMEKIENKIYLIREQKVMLDRDLAKLYGVSTSAVNQAVKRNIERFPADFMFSLTRNEILRISQFVISSDAGRIGLKYSKNVNAFNEQGVAMLSSVLRSKRAIQVNIAIMRAFVKLRQMLAKHKELMRKFKELENRVDKHDKQIILIFDAINKMLETEKKPEKRIGFLPK